MCSAIEDEMNRDPNVFLMGEEVGQFQGAYKLTKGLYQKFGPTRIFDTPISEMGFTGIGVGASMHGVRPIIEFMTWNFALQSIDQIINSAAKIHYMSAGDIKCPIVFRGLNGAAAGVAAQHSQDFSSWYASVPGLKVVSPYSAEDCRGLLKAAVRDDNPVLILENEIMYGRSFPKEDYFMDKDFVVPIGKAKVERQGKDVSIITFSKMVGESLDSAAELEKEGISVEVVNLRTLRPLDRTTILNSVRKTHRCVTVEEGWPQSGIGSEICAIIMESKFFLILADAFDYLDAPVERVTGFDVPMPYAVNLEKMALPRKENIISAVKRTLARKI